MYYYVLLLDHTNAEWLSLNIHSQFNLAKQEIQELVQQYNLQWAVPIQSMFHINLSQSRILEYYVNNRYEVLVFESSGYFNDIIIEYYGDELVIRMMTKEEEAELYGSEEDVDYDINY